jgi:hypothetical protein
MRPAVEIDSASDPLLLTKERAGVRFSPLLTKELQLQQAASQWDENGAEVANSDGDLFRERSFP